MSDPNWATPEHANFELDAVMLAGKQQHPDTAQVIQSADHVAELTTAETVGWAIIESLPPEQLKALQEYLDNHVA